VLLLASLVLTRWVDQRGPAGRGHDPPPPAQHIRNADGALGIFLRNRYLLFAALATLLLNWVNTNGENLLFRVVQEVLDARAAAQGITDPDLKQSFILNGTSAFYGNFYRLVNTTALVLQALVASRLLRYGGFGAIMLMLPVVALLSYSAMALLPVLGVIKIMKIAENGTDYSINNTARHALWLPLRPEIKYKGKATIDTLFVRLGDGLAALTVLVGVQVLALTTQTFFAFTVSLVVLLLVASIGVVREHRRITGGTVRAR